MSNKKSGNQFEAELCEILSEHGFWCHRMAQDSDGQPADVIAVKNGCAYLIDCKVCSTGRFALNRIEENQAMAMKLWRECGNGVGWFALKFSDKIYMASLGFLESYRNLHASIPESFVANWDLDIEEWLRVRA